ncbi:hypothetical protein IEQ34_014198 [Dendrobium chrysotoxum]|uniref:Disease resistance N-terminal domain-containing protein n=1 Tax=Dendrobium chrysotoxum TaxID=161865 RepID=A0AAV7GJJ8_DENCH|nr:hypothetical protein IEQ34_014198 [Dendrobium chrysotoxum]
MKRIQKFLEATERRRPEDLDINQWISELKDVAYDTDDIIDLCRIQGALLLLDQPSSSKKILVCFNFSLLSSYFASILYRYQIAENPSKKTSKTIGETKAEACMEKLGRGMNFRSPQGFEQGRMAQVLPQLDELLIDNCPKFQALSECLEWSKMKIVDIEGAHNLRAVQNLCNLKEELRLINILTLERVSRIHELKVLVLCDFSELNFVENIDSLQRLELLDEFIGKYRFPSAAA